ncbi:MAG: metalloprotease secretion chaperone CpaB [Methylococcales bacterium]|nr:metalloprotease secretion chaperone CpaB [Methylococcales bacterium]
MKPSKLFLISLLLTILIAYVVNYSIFPSNPLQNVVVKNSDIKGNLISTPKLALITKQHSIPVDVLVDQELLEKIEKIEQRRPNFNFSLDELENTLNTKSPYQIIPREDVIDALDYLTEKQKTDSRTFIQYDPYVIETKFKNDVIELYIPGLDTSLKATIIQIDSGSMEGVIRWSGHFELFAGKPLNSFSLTQSIEDLYVAGTVVTPYGSYNIESKNGYGWVVDQKTDFFLPESGVDTLAE